MKTQRILKSLTDLANALALATNVQHHGAEMTKRVLGPPARATRRQMRFARHRSLKFMADLTARANAPFKTTNYWPHGGLNE